MKAETWEKLNGTGWGDEPRAITDNPCNGTLEIPAFMRSDYISVSTVVPVSAYRAQGKGRMKHVQHMKEKRLRDVVNGVFWFFVAVAAFALLINLGLLIC